MEYVLKQIRDQRLKSNVTLDELSKLTGISVHYLKQMEECTIDPNLSCLVKVASALNITIIIGDISI